MQNVKVVCRALIRDEQNRLLLIKNNGNTFWCLPGGSLESTDASVQRCLERELHEELGVTAQMGDISFFQEMHKGDIRYIELVLKASVIQGELPTSESIRHVSGGELEDICWATEEDLIYIDAKPERLRKMTRASQ